MARITTGAFTTFRLDTHLDPMTLDLFGLRELISTPAYTAGVSFPAYTAANVAATIDSSKNWGFGKVPAQRVDIGLVRGFIATEEASIGIAWRRQAIAGYGAYDLYGADTNSGSWLVGRHPGNNTGYVWATGDLTALTVRMLLDVNGNLLINRNTQQSGGKLEVEGNIVLQPAGGAPTLANNGDMSFQLVSNTSLKILVRGSDGVTRSATLTLA